MTTQETKTSSGLERAIYVSWEESERGWGERPDGCSLHLSEGDYQTYLKNYWDGMTDAVPNEYSRPAGSPVSVMVDKTLYTEIVKGNKGIRLFQSGEREAVKNKQLIYGNERSGWRDA